MLMFVVAVSASAFVAGVTRANPSSVRTSGDTAWFRTLRGSHRQLFDRPSPNGGVSLVHLMN
jgi:hypothetical protein